MMVSSLSLPTPVDHPTLIVVYATGAPPSEVAVPLASWARCVFVLAPDDDTLRYTPLLASFGKVVVLDGVEVTAERLKDYNPDGIITYNEQMQRVTARLAELLDLPYHSTRTAELLTDKWQQRAAMRAAGVDSVRTALIDSEWDWAAAAAAVGFPAVLKPVHGVASGNTFYVPDEATGRVRLDEVLALEQPGLVAGGGLVLEEFLPGRPCGPWGDYVSVEVAVHHGQMIDLAVTGKLPMARPFRETGRFWPSPFPSAENDDFFALARAAITAVGVESGITHTEIKLTPQGPRLIEVNGRLGGGIQDLSLSSGGLDLVSHAARIALDEPIQLKPPHEGGGVHFQILVPAPKEACELVSIEGTETIQALEEVTTCRIYVRPGARLPGGVGTFEIGRIAGMSAGHDAFAELVQTILATLRFRLRFDQHHEARVVTADDLFAS